MNENIFDKLDFGPFRSLLDNDDITDISYDNNGQIWIRSLTQGSLRVEVEGATPEFVEKLAFQCSNVMGTTFNNAKPFLDAESAELRMNFVHQSIATNGIALVIRKTPAKIRLEKEKLIQEDYFTPAIHDFLIKCVEGHCNIMVAGETGSGKTEFVKYLASHTKTNEKIITIEDTLELHLDKIFPQRDIVSMKTNNVASYSDVLVTCMRQNPKWILLSEVRSAEAVSAVRNSISSGHNILSTIHADKASAIPYRLYSLMETDLDVHQFLSTIYRYIQLGVHIKAFYSKEYGKFHRELDEVCEFYVDDDNVPRSRIIYQKMFGKPMMCKPSDHLVEYLENQNVEVQDIIRDLPNDLPIHEYNEKHESDAEKSGDANPVENNKQDVSVESNEAGVNDSTSSSESVSDKVSVSPEGATSTAPVPVVSENPQVATPNGNMPALAAPVVEGQTSSDAISSPLQASSEVSTPIAPTVSAAVSSAPPVASEAVSSAPPVVSEAASLAPVVPEVASIAPATLSVSATPQVAAAPVSNPSAASVSVPSVADITPVVSSAVPQQQVVIQANDSPSLSPIVGATPSVAVAKLGE